MRFRKAALASGLLAFALTNSAGQAAFIVSAVTNGVPVNGRQRVDLIAFNDGIGGSGTKLLAVDVFFTSLRTKVYFGVEDLLPTNSDGDPQPDGIFDTVNFYNSPTLQPQTSQLRLSSAPGATIPTNPSESEANYLGFTPDPIQNPRGTPYAGGRTSFDGTYGTLGAADAPVANGTNGGSPSGASFGRLYIDAGGSFTLTGRLAGDFGPAFPFTVVYVTTPEPASLLMMAAMIGFAARRQR